MEEHLVSIITPTYNSEKFIEETIQGILSQTYKNWELLITDDCSTDSTWGLLQNYASKDERIKIFKLSENSGAGATRNNSIKKSRGRFIAFCDSDDIWFPDKLRKQINFMIENNLSLSYSAYRKITETGEKKGEIYPPKTITFKYLLKTNAIGCSTAIYDREKIGKMYMPLIRRRQDYGLWLKIHKKINFSMGIVDELLVYYRVREKSVSSNKFKAAVYHLKVLKECGGVNVFLLSYYFFCYAIKGLLKYIK